MTADTELYPKYDLLIYKNGTKRMLLQFVEDDEVTAIPITAGTTGKMDFRDKPGGYLYFSLSTSGAGLVIDEDDGEVYIEMTPTETDLLEVDEGSYDLLLSVAGVNDYPLHGTFKVIRNTTE